jgi:ATP-binding cassette, subfamily B, bacterial MsbA
MMRDTKILFHFGWGLLWGALAERRILVFKIVTATLMLSLSHVLILTFTQGFLTTIFQNQDKEWLQLSELLPQSDHFQFKWVEQWNNYTLARSSLIVAMPLFIIGYGLLRSMATYFYNYSQEELALRIARQHRETMFSRVMALPYLKSSQRSPGEWMSVIMSDASYLQNRFGDLLTGFFKDSIEIVVPTIYMIWISPILGGVLLLLLPVIGFVMGKAGRRISYFAQRVLSELGMMASAVLGMRERFRFMKGQKAEEFERRLFEKSNDTFLRMIQSSLFIRSLVTPAMEWTGFVIFAALIFAWSKGWMHDVLPPKTTFLFFATFGAVLRPVRQFGEQLTKLGETVGGLHRSLKLYQETELVVQGDQSRKKIPPPHLKGEQFKVGAPVLIQKLEVRYSDRTAVSMDDLSIPPGKAIAVVGSSGAGKSTLIKTLAGVIAPTCWQGTWDYDHFWKQTSFVSQMPFLFRGTIQENLIYGLEDEDRVRRDVIEAALRTVHMLDVVKSLPLGLEAVFDPLKPVLSGGQVQRLVIARALLRGRPLLLLDEGTSALDGATEKALMETLIAIVHESHTGLISVTHRVQCLPLYDEIWIMKDGVLASSGRYADLLAAGKLQSFVSGAAES